MGDSIMSPKSRADFIIGEITRESGERPYLVLMTSTHPMTDINLCHTGHKIVNLDINNFPIKWQREQAVPSNMRVITSLDELEHRPDFILSQNIVDQFPVWANLQFQFDCPIISFEHTLPTETWVQQGIHEKIRSDLKNFTRVFITDFSKKEWNCENEPNAHVLYHMVDTDKFHGWIGGNGRSMVLVNQFSGREWAVGDVENLLITDVKYGGQKIDLFGHNAGYKSKPLYGNEVVTTMQDYDVFINTSIKSPLPASVLEAAAVGMPIISRKTCAIPEFFEHGKNILFYSTYEECIEMNKELLSDKQRRKQLGAAAREVVLSKFNKDRYINDWNKIFKSAKEIYGHQA